MMKNDLEQSIVLNYCFENDVIESEFDQDCKCVWNICIKHHRGGKESFTFYLKLTLNKIKRALAKTEMKKEQYYRSSGQNYFGSITGSKSLNDLSVHVYP
jgi:hypothetical protein